MFLQQVRLVVLEGQEAAFEAGLVEVRRRVFMSPGFRGFTVAQGAEDPSTYLVEVRWETAEELAQLADSAPAERRCWAPVGSFLSGPPLVDYFVERPSLGHQGPGSSTDLDLAWLSE